jgi:hypothetical protein
MVNRVGLVIVDVVEGGWKLQTWTIKMKRYLCQSFHRVTLAEKLEFGGIGLL